jgi:hypothetical protein
LIVVCKQLKKYKEKFPKELCQAMENWPPEECWQFHYDCALQKHEDCKDHKRVATKWIQDWEQETKLSKDEANEKEKSTTRKLRNLLSRQSN